LSARRKSLLTFLVVPLVLVLSLVGIGVADAVHSGSATKARHDLAVPTITISAFTFHSPASVKKGVQVKVINKDAVGHTVTSDIAGRFNVKVPAHSTRFFKAPVVAGSYKYHCTPHPSMHGVLRVVN
jgi:plastocyanin